LGACWSPCPIREWQIIDQPEDSLDRKLLQEILASKIAYHLALSGIEIPTREALNVAAQIATGWDVIEEQCIKKTPSAESENRVGRD
jgi:hypothetical protein